MPDSKKRKEKEDHNSKKEETTVTKKQKVESGKAKAKGKKKESEQTLTVTTFMYFSKSRDEPPGKVSIHPLLPTYIHVHVLCVRSHFRLQPAGSIRVYYRRRYQV